MTSRYMKGGPVSPITRWLQTKTTMKYHLPPASLAIIEKTGNNKCWWGCKVSGTFTHCLWEYKIVQPLWKTVWQFSSWNCRCQVNTPIPVLKKNESLDLHTDITLPKMARKWKLPKCPLIDKCINTLWNIQILECYSLIKRNMIHAMTWMNF